VITFFTTAKAFEGHSGIIQRNALKSWKLLRPDVEVILFGDDAGADEVCAELELRHEPHVERHESGMKYLDYMFRRAQQIARYPYLCYSNCDIVLTEDFRRAFETATQWRKRFLLIAQRWDTDVTAPLAFDRKDWANDLQQLAMTSGFRQIPHYVDFFVFSKGLYDDVPPLVVGRSFWDHWLVWKALSSGSPVLDCTPSIVPVHQNHGYGYHPLGKQGTNEDALAMRNIALSGGGRHLRYIIHATHKLESDGRIHWITWRRVVRGCTPRSLKQSFAEATLPLRKRLGLRREAIGKILGRRTSSS